MDYIIFGIGVGASLVLIGWLFREYGPALRDRKGNDVERLFSAQELVAQMAWARFCRAAGTACTLGGMILLLSTIIVILFKPGDRTGALVISGILGLVVIGMLIWAALFTARFGTHGIYRPKPKSIPEYQNSGTGDEQADDPADDLPSDSQPSAPRRPRSANREPETGATSPADVPRDAPGQRSIEDVLGLPIEEADAEDDDEEGAFDEESEDAGYVNRDAFDDRDVGSGAGQRSLEDVLGLPGPAQDQGSSSVDEVPIVDSSGLENRTLEQILGMPERPLPDELEQSADNPDAIDGSPIDDPDSDSPAQLAGLEGTDLTGSDPAGEQLEPEVVPDGDRAIEDAADKDQPGNPSSSG